MVAESKSRELFEGFWHRKGRVEFATNQTGVFFLAILTGFRDVNQPKSAVPNDMVLEDSSQDCDSWAKRSRGWDRGVACVMWFGCDDAKKNNTCTSLRCNCL